MKRAQYTTPSIACAFVGAAVLGFPASTHAQDQHLVKSTAADHDVAILSYARSNQNCDGIEPPKLYLDKPPEHGIVCFLASQVRLLDAVVGNLTQCLGRKIGGVTIVYRPATRYSGIDELRYTVIFPETSQHVDVDLTVVPDQSSARNAPLRDVGSLVEERAQSSGPMPVCTALMS